jgi:hypothetical protein
VVLVETWVASVEIQMAVFVEIQMVVLAAIQMVILVGILVGPAGSLVAFLVHRILRVSADGLLSMTCQTVEALFSVDRRLEPFEFYVAVRE